MKKFINQEVEVNAFYFVNGQNFKKFPRAITLGDERYTFRDGLQMLVHQGQEIVRVFTMSDGSSNYRLREQNDHWTLIGIEGV